jgi:DNA processing protein
MSARWRARPAIERRAWIALAGTTGVGDVTFQRLIGHYGSASGALRAVADLAPDRADRALAAAMGLPVRAGLAARIRESSDQAGRIERAMRALGGWVETPLDDTFPAQLHDLPDPPPVLYGLGRRSALDVPGLVAVVGTRHPTGIGRDLAARIGSRLAGAGVGVVSGLAVGIDAVAHWASLEVGGTTIGVAGSGLDRPAPRANDRLVGRILASGGAIVSELAPGVLPTAGTFPRRNRLISVLASATVVVEAPARSGALITARHALEQGRRLLVVPGRPLDPSVAGCLALLRESPARPVVGLDELIEDLGLDGVQATAHDGSMPVTLTGLSPLERSIARALTDGPGTSDQLISRTGREPGEVAAALTILQLRGLARSHGSLLLAAGPLLAAGAELSTPVDGGGRK